jgi:hypothetical protein
MVSRGHVGPIFRGAEIFDKPGVVHGAGAFFDSDKSIRNASDGGLLFKDAIVVWIDKVAAFKSHGRRIHPGIAGIAADGTGMNCFIYVWIRRTFENSSGF